MKYCVRVHGTQSTLVFNAVISTGDCRGWRHAPGEHNVSLPGFLKRPGTGGPSRQTLTRSVFFRIERSGKLFTFNLPFTCENDTLRNKDQFPKV